MSKNVTPNDEELPYKQDIQVGVDDKAGKSSRQKVEQRSSRGDSHKTIANLFSGFNHRMAPLYAPKNLDTMGMTFFTRPDLNLTEANLRVSRRLSEMMRGGYGSQAAAIVAMLDPVNALMSKDRSHVKLGSATRDALNYDNRQAFMPVLSNLLLSLTGFPDNTLDTYTSEEGIKREQWSMVDSTYQINYAYSLNASFRNIEGDPISTIFTMWLEYMAGVKDGTFVPRARNIIQNEIDYQTRIYRLIMDPSRRFVRKIGIANAAFPVNDGLGAIMNMAVNTPFITNNDQIDIQFQCIGAQYMDPILIQEFNDVVAMFNPDMLPYDPDSSDYLPKGKDDLMRLNNNDVGIFNYFGYPHIDNRTYELSWYVPSDLYDAVMGELNG